MSSTDWSLLIGAITALIGTIGIVLRQNGKARALAVTNNAAADVKIKEAEATRLSAEASMLIAKADVMRMEAEARKTAEENTGRFLTMADGDRKQSVKFVEEMQKRMDALERANVALERELQELRDSLRDEKFARVQAEEERDNLERSRDAIWEELEKWHQSAKSDGAYPPPTAMAPPERRRPNGPKALTPTKKDPTQ